MKLDSAHIDAEARRSQIDDLAMAEPVRSEPDVLDLFLVMAKRKKTIFRFVGAALVLALALSIFLPARYTSTAVILPPQQTQSTASMLMTQLAGAGGLNSLAAVAGKDLGIKNPSDIYIGMLKSRTVADAIIGKYGLQQVYGAKRLSQAQKNLANATDISSEKTGLIDIAVEDKDPKRAADLANAYVAELRRLTQTLAVTEASQRRLFFEQQVEEAKNNLSNAEVALKDTEQKTGMIHLDSQAKAIIDSIGRLQAQVAAKEVELRAMRSFATNENPDMVIAEQELSGLQSELAKLEKRQTSVAGDPIVVTNNIPEYGLEYARRLRDVKYQETIFELLAKQFEAAKLDEAKEAAIIQVVDAGVVADHKSSPHATIIIPVAVFLGLLLGILWSFAAEGWSRMLHDEDTRNRIVLFKRYIGLKQPESFSGHR